MERHDKRLTEHFCLDEFTYSGIAVDNAINNQPPPCACLALQNLEVGLLEPLRAGKIVGCIAMFRFSI